MHSLGIAFVGVGCLVLLVCTVAGVFVYRYTEDPPEVIDPYDHY